MRLKWKPIWGFTVMEVKGRKVPDATSNWIFILWLRPPKLM